MLARVPASSANLGPGFDAIAVALTRYVEVSVELAESFSITSKGYGAGLYDDEHHLGARVAASVLGHDRFAIHVNSEIPLSRGLGSSASLALAAAAAAGSASPLDIATEVDGHAENAAASLLGGLVVASVDERYGIVARSLLLDPAWRFVVVVPDEELPTADARRVLPNEVPFKDAVRNVSAVALLIAGLARHEDFAPGSMDDHLHQPYRMSLLPFAQPLLAHLREAGAAGSCWSGAGSTMLALCNERTSSGVAQEARNFLVAHSVPGEVWELDADRRGLQRS
ncbi:MAG: homoserine kinase [Acidimicrobiaceae bacterium]|nr:homoserine kinase [Acidimicrobiaceae bacterium]